MPLTTFFKPGIVSESEIFLVLGTGTHPVYFQESPDHYLWGKGTLFLAEWNGVSFAITARHVIEKQYASSKDLQLFVPEYKTSIAVSGATTPKCRKCTPQHEFDDIDDIIIFVVNGSDVTPAWDSWRMQELSMPARKLKAGEQLFSIGYPHSARDIDYENNNQRKATPLISVGMLSNDSIGEGIFTIDCAAFDIDLDNVKDEDRDEHIDKYLSGISGGPVFSRIDGTFRYVGMIVRGGVIAQKIHFICSSYVTSLMDHKSKSILKSNL